MVIGEYSRLNDFEVNAITAKQLTNMHASGTDSNVRIAPKLNFSLEESIKYIQKDEYLEVTPKSLRMHKIYLEAGEL